MNRFLLVTDAVQSAFGWIAETSLTSIPVIILIHILRRLLRDRLPARWTYLLWTLVALRLLVPWTPDSSFSMYQWVALPEWVHTAQNQPSSTEILPHEYNPASSRASEFNNQTDTVAAHNEAIQRLDAASMDKLLDNVISAPTASEPENHEYNLPGSEALSDVTSLHPSDTVNEFSFSLNALLAIIWLIGAAGAAFIMIRSNRKLSRSIRLYATEVIDERILRQLVECEKSLKLHRRVKIYAVERSLSAPALSGIWSPKLLLPADALHILTEEQLRHIMLHELSHMKRWDLPMNALMHMLLAVHWFNPLLWHAYSAMREDQELACDALALSMLKQEDNREYALTIIKLLEAWSAPVRLANTAGLSGNKTQLKRRITMITKRRRAGIHRTLLGIAVIVIAAGCSLTGAPEPDKPQSSSPNERDTIRVESDDFSSEIRVAGLPDGGSQADTAELNPSSDEPIVDEKYGRLLASLDDFRLYAKVTEEPNPDKERALWPIYHFNEYTLVRNGKTKTFPWSTVTDDYSKSLNPPIQMEMQDVDADGRNELIVKISTYRMTYPELNTIYIEQLHVINPKDLSETPLSDPVNAVYAAVDSSIIPEGDKMVITATNGSEQLVEEEEVTNANASDDGGGGAYWNDHLVFGRNVFYFISDDGVIRAGLPGAASTGGGLSFSTLSAVVTYNRDFSVQSVDLIS